MKKSEEPKQEKINIKPNNKQVKLKKTLMLLFRL